MKIQFLIALCLPLAAACAEKPDEAPAPAGDTAQQPAPLSRSISAEDARVFFIRPADGDTVSNPVSVVFGTEGMAVRPAGDDMPHSGHHHLLIDTELPELGLPIPKDEHHMHFGDGSTKTEITLEPGEHTLQLLLGDHLHIPHDPPLSSAKITVTVK
jgi:hypothetical protein